MTEHDPTWHPFLRRLHEATAFRSDVDPPARETADWLWREYDRDVVNATPQQRERIEREIRRSTGVYER